jgi:hypothetical protein
MIAVLVGLVGLLVGAVVLVIGLPFIILFVVALCAVVVLALLFGLTIAFLKLALFFVLPALLVWWILKAVFGLGRKASVGVGSDL